MTSNRLILVFLGLIFVIIVILGSSRIAGALRERFGRFFPAISPLTTEVTPTPTIEVETPSPTPTSPPVPQVTTKGGAAIGEIPATGPHPILFFLLPASLLTQALIRKITTKS